MITTCKLRAYSCVFAAVALMCGCDRAHESANSSEKAEYDVAVMKMIEGERRANNERRRQIDRAKNDFSSCVTLLAAGQPKAAAPQISAVQIADSCANPYDRLTDMLAADSSPDEVRQQEFILKRGEWDSRISAVQAELAKIKKPTEPEPKITIQVPPAPPADRIMPTPRSDPRTQSF